jgi:hypothetical protein
VNSYGNSRHQYRWTAKFKHTVQQEDQVKHEWNTTNIATSFNLATFGGKILLTCTINKFELCKFIGKRKTQQF